MKIKVSNQANIFIQRKKKNEKGWMNVPVAPLSDQLEAAAARLS